MFASNDDQLGGHVQDAIPAFCTPRNKNKSVQRNCHRTTATLETALTAAIRCFCPKRCLFSSHTHHISTPIEQRQLPKRARPEAVQPAKHFPVEQCCVLG